MRGDVDAELLEASILLLFLSDDSRDLLCTQVGGLGLTTCELIVTRALSREKRIEAPERRQSILNQLNGTPSPNRKLARQDSKVLSRVSMYDSSVHNGPTVLGAGVNAQVTTAMTRSIGDWDGSRAMIPHPDVNRFEVGHGEWVRVVLASDGIWDRLEDQEAVDAVREAPPHTEPYMEPYTEPYLTLARMGGSSWRGEPR